MNKYILVVAFVMSCVAAKCQVFTTLAKNENIITLQDGNLRLNTLQFDGKIYYTVYTGNGNAEASVLCVVDVNGKNGRQLPQTIMIGANFLAATEKYIYYNSYVAAIKQYYFYRMNIITEKVELIIDDDKGNPWIYGTDITKIFSKMYTYKDKLALVGFLNQKGAKVPLRTLCIIDDSIPVARFLATALLDTKTSNGFVTDFYPQRDEIAITDTSIYYYYYNITKKETLILSHAKNFSKNQKPYQYPQTIPLAKYGYEPLQSKLIFANNKFYTLLKKTNDQASADSVYLLEGQNFSASSVGQPFILNAANVFMKAFGSTIYFGDRMHLYKYETTTKKITPLIQLKQDAAGLLYGISLIQNQEYLLQAADKTVFVAINTFHDFGPNVVRKNGYQKVLAIYPNNKIDTVITSRSGIYCSREGYDVDRTPIFILGNSLYLSNYENDYVDYLEKYSKENQWKPVRINLPEIKKFDKFGPPIYSPNVLQMPYGLLINTKYRSNNKKKDINMMYLYTE